MKKKKRKASSKEEEAKLTFPFSSSCISPPGFPVMIFKSSCARSLSSTTDMPTVASTFSLFIVSQQKGDKCTLQLPEEERSPLANFLRLIEGLEGRRLRGEMETEAEVEVEAEDTEE